MFTESPNDCLGGLVCARVATNCISGSHPIFKTTMCWYVSPKARCETDCGACIEESCS